MARTWCYNEDSAQIQIEKIKSFQMVLVNSKFNKLSFESQQQLIATGGSSPVVTVWNAKNSKDVAKLDHQKLDP